MQTRVLLSIKPEFANQIFAGTKRFEFRRTIFRSEKVTTVVVYASSPVQRVIGEFSIERIIALEPSELWQKTNKHGGIQKEHFDRYFSDKDTGFAIQISKPILYKRPKLIESVCNTTQPPQSFRYL
jgi:predicted transcriptional regulator